jgi:hypothetical protein
LLDVIAPPPAAPWSEDTQVMCSLATRYARPAPQVTFSSLDIALDGDLAAGDTDRWASAADPTAVVRALLSGGSAAVGDPAHRQLPAWIASLERWMPDAVVARTRRGVWTAASGGIVKPDRVAEIGASGWRDRTSAAARAWRLLVELSEARAQSVDEVAAELAHGDDAARSALTDEERRALSMSTRSLVDVLHAWGRGRLDQCPTAGTLTERLADAVALRVLARLADGTDPRAVIAEARWHALLPAARRATLLDAVASRASSLRRLLEDPEATHA